MSCRRGCKSLKDGHCAFVVHSTLLTTLRNMASAHKIFKRCWLHRDLDTERPRCKRGAYVRSAVAADRQLPPRIHALIYMYKVFPVLSSICTYECCSWDIPCFCDRQLRLTSLHITSPQTFMQYTENLYGWGNN